MEPNTKTKPKRMLTRQKKTRQQIKHPKSFIGPRNKPFYHKHDSKRKSPLLKIPGELRVEIYNYFFHDSRMIHISRTHQGDFRRKYGSQALLFVNKLIRQEALAAFYELCTFSVLHYHMCKSKWKSKIPLDLTRLRKLTIVWSKPPRKGIDTPLDSQALLQLQNLEDVTIDMKGIQYCFVSGAILEEEIQMHVLQKFEHSMQNWPLWLRNLAQNAQSRFKLYFWSYFFGAPIPEPTFFARAKIGPVGALRAVVAVEPANFDFWKQNRTVEGKVDKMEGDEARPAFGRRLRHCAKPSK